MTHRDRRRFSILLIVVLTMVLGLPARAQNYEHMNTIEQELYGDYAMVNGDYQTMKNVRRYWSQQAQRLKYMKQLEFAFTGSNESILKVTIPHRVLFAQNDSTLLTSADAVLRPLLRLVKGNDAVATLIIASYSDNNGSERYLKLISGSRARQVYRWFARQGVGPNEMHSYGWGNQVPRNENASIQQRERNRRISIYLVPNRRMLRLAKRGQL